MEHYYQNIQGWFNFEDIYNDMIAKASDGSTFVEVGSWLGKSASYMGVEIIKSGKKIKFDCVDIWELSQDDPYYIENFKGIEGIYDTFLSNMNKSNAANVVNPIKLDSLSAAALYEDNSLDFVFIDANHHYEFVKKDIEAWYPKIKPGGYIGGHDYGGGVQTAVDEFFKKDLKLSGTSWLHLKK